MAAVSPAGPEPMMTIFSCRELPISGQYNVGLEAARPDLDDALGSPAVPQVGPLTDGEAVRQHLVERGPDPVAIPSDQLVGPDLAGDGPLGVLAQGQTRHPQGGGL